MEKKKLMIVIMIFMTVFQVQAQIGEPGTAWTTRGNFATDNRDFLGTITNYPFSLKTNDAVRMYFDTNGNIGVKAVPPGHQAALMVLCFLEVLLILLIILVVGVLNICAMRMTDMA